jgi:hypothetical protein
MTRQDSPVLCVVHHAFIMLGAGRTVDLHSYKTKSNQSAINLQSSCKQQHARAYNKEHHYHMNHNPLQNNCWG